MSRLLCLLLSMVVIPAALAQHPGLNFQVKGLKSPVVVMGYFQGGKAYRLDSVRVDTTHGRFIWKKQGLEPGVYFCSNTNGKLFDFIVTGPADSSYIGADLSQKDSLWSPNSAENEAFFRFEQHRKFLEGKFEAKKSMRSMVAQASKNDPEALRPIDAELRGLLEKTDSLALDYVQQHPAHLYTSMLRSVRPPEPPHQLKPMLKNGKANPEYARWLRRHYWDNTDFTEEALLRNTFWQVYFDNFFSRHVVVQADSIIQGIDEILAKTPRNGAFFRFIVLRITQYYEQNDAPGADRIFVHMVDRYLKKQETPWLDQATLERLAYKADAHRPNLTGSLAVNFTLPDETGKPVELYGIQASYTLLIFYSPLCSHCMEVMPNIYQVFLDFQAKGLAAVALNTDQETEYWRKFAGQQHWDWYDVADPKMMEQVEKQYAAANLPVIYILDKNKKILAKKVPATELGAVLSSYFNPKKD